VIRRYSKILTNKPSNLPLKAADAVRSTAAAIKNCPKKRDPKIYRAPNFYRTPNLTDFKIDFNKSGLKETFEKNKIKLGISNESKLNLEVKAGTNTIFNLLPAVRFARVAKSTYPNAKIQITIRLDDPNKKISKMSKEEQFEYFKDISLPSLLKRAFPDSTPEEIDSKRKYILSELEEVLNNFAVDLRFVPQQVSNSVYESCQSITVDYKNQLNFTHHIELVQDSSLQGRVNLGIAKSLKDMKEKGERVYPNIAVLDTGNFNNWRTFKDALLEYISRVYDSGKYFFTGDIRRPSGNDKPHWIQAVKYRISEGPRTIEKNKT
jgi:hypothetical protein